MANSPSRSPYVFFNNFQVDLRSGELRKNGRKIRIQSLPFQLLSILIERPNELITREEVSRRLWPEDTFVDFDHSIGTAINKLRGALGDSAGKPRYVETIPRRGFRFIGRIEQTADPPPRTRDGRLRKHPSLPIRLLVMPFQNFSGNAVQEYFTDGLTEEMISQLGRLNGSQLGVIARTTSMAYKNTTKDIAQIGRELSVDYVLESSVRRQGDQVRITVQLIRASDQVHVWTNNYDRKVRDSIAVQEEVAREVAQQIDVSLSHPEARRTLDPAANELYLRGRFFLNHFTPDGYRQAADHFNRVVETDPNFAPAYAGIAEAYAFLVITNMLSPQEAWPRVRDAAKKAVELDNTLCEGCLTHALFRMHMWDWKGADPEFKRALSQNLSNEKAHRWYAIYLTSLNKHDEAVEQVLISRDLDPLSSITNVEVGRELYYARQYEQAVQEACKAELLNPHYARVHFWMGRAYSQMARHDEALARAERSGAPGSVIQLTEIAYAAARAGMTGRSREVLQTLKEHARHYYVPAYDFAVIHTALGEKDLALDYLQEAYHEHCWALIVLGVEPRLDPLRSDPRFQRLAQKIGLPAS